MKTSLLNTDGEEVAASERVKNTISTFASRHREGLTPAEVSNGSGSSVGVSILFIYQFNSHEKSNFHFYSFQQRLFSSFW